MKNIFFNSFIRQLYKRNDQGSRVIVIAALSMLVVLFVLLHFRSPLLQSSYFRDHAIHNFLTDIQQKQRLDMEKFWEFRDALGAVVTYNEDYLNPQSILEFKHIPQQTVQLFQYNAKDFVTKEYVVLPEDKEGFVKTTTDESILFADQQTIIVFDQSQNLVRIVTVLPFEEMKKHNGMIDYGELKQNLGERLWITSSLIFVSPNFSIDSL